MPFLSVFSDSFPANSPEDALLCGLILSVWAGKASVRKLGAERQDPPPSPTAPLKELCVLVLLLFCLS